MAVAVPAGAPPEPVNRPPQVLLSPEVPVREAAQNALTTGLEGLIFHRPGVIAGEVEPLHQLRVTARRLRAVVELFDGVIHATRANIYRRDLRWVGHTAGAVRECDVWQELLRDLSTKLQPSMRDALAPVYEALAERRRAELAKVVELLESDRYRKLMVRLSSTLLKKTRPGLTVGSAAVAMVRPTARAVARVGATLQESSTSEAFHRLRIRVKRLRYMLEMLRKIGGKRTKKAVRRLEEMQELLGTHHDAVTAIAWLREFAVSATVAPATLLAVGALIQSLDKRARKLAIRTVKDWKRLNRSAVIADALAEIAHNGRAAAPLENETVHIS
jgi:CHAD domain-containing protein